MPYASSTRTILQNLLESQQKMTGPRKLKELRQSGYPSGHAICRFPFIDGQDASTIMLGSQGMLTALWARKRNDNLAPRDDRGLTETLDYWTRSFNRHWYEYQTGFDVIEPTAIWQSTRERWRLANPHGLVWGKNAIWHAKHVEASEVAQNILSKHMPELQHNMAVCEVGSSILSILYGLGRWDCIEVAADEGYQEALYLSEKRFWECIQSGRAPDIGWLRGQTPTDLPRTTTSPAGPLGSEK